MQDLAMVLIPYILFGWHLACNDTVNSVFGVPIQFTQYCRRMIYVISWISTVLLVLIYFRTNKQQKN
jgi:uncharacterized membrane protein YuzA (DUF378 family)